MKKLVFLGVILVLCGCSIVDESITDIKSTKYGLAKNKVSGYAKNVKVAYTDYQYASAMGTYAPAEGSIPVNVDGNIVYLNVKNYGSEEDRVNCTSISVVNGAVKLDGCTVFGYEFMYDGETILKNDKDAIQK